MKLTPMKYRTWIYITAIAVNFLFAFGFYAPTYAQKVYKKVPTKRDNPKKEKKEVVPDTIPFYNGTYIGVDLYGLGCKLFGDCISSEVNLSVNLKNKFIPAIEFGMGAADSWSETGIHYKSKASPFIRIGMDYNTMAKKKNKNSYLYVGFRYGYSKFKYSVSSLPNGDGLWKEQLENPAFQDEIWHTDIPFNHSDFSGSMQWLEFLVGVKIQVIKNLNMGWAVRMKYKTSVSNSEFANPWYVPGYGKFKSSNMGITYSIIYKLPL